MGRNIYTQILLLSKHAHMHMHKHRSVAWDAFSADPTEARAVVSKYLAELDVVLALDNHVREKGVGVLGWAELVEYFAHRNLCLANGSGPA